jgi:hypothetical protein
VEAADFRHARAAIDIDAGVRCDDQRDAAA